MASSTISQPRLITLEENNIDLEKPAPVDHFRKMYAFSTSVFVYPSVPEGINEHYRSSNLPSHRKPIDDCLYLGNTASNGPTQYCRLGSETCVS